MENAYGHDIVTGLGTYFLDPREGNWTLGDITRQMYVSRDAGMGHAHFRSHFLTSNRQGIYDFERQFNATPSLPPATKKGKAEDAPVLLSRTPLVQRPGDGSARLNWKGASPYYNIYASRSFPVDTRDARNLICTRYGGLSLRLKDVSPALYFAVTAMDRYGRESSPLQEEPLFTLQTSPALLDNDGTTLMLPAMARQADIVRYEIQTLQGQMFRSSRHWNRKHGKLDISALPDGIYQLLGRTRKNRSYVLGTFLIRRK